MLSGPLPVAPPNRLTMLTDYIEPEERAVACPNQDVVYGNGVLALDQSPVVIQVPDFGDRFWVYQIVDGRTDSFASLGKMYGTRPGFYLLVGPDWQGEVPKGIAKVFRAQTNSGVVIPRVFQGDTPEDKMAVQPILRGIGMYPIPVLTRDIPGYRITPHTDTKWKGITVQLYLPRDASATHIGTIFHDRLSDGSLPKAKQMKFAPNTGYAFAVGDNTWHSADPVGGEVDTRDSILLTYFVDAGMLRFFRNRGKRVGNFVLNEARNLPRYLAPGN